MNEKSAAKRIVPVVLVVLTFMHFPAQAASRFGGPDDDSVCDVGDVSQRSARWPVAWDFVNSQCKNGQLLIGSSIESATGGFEIEGLARSFCRIADIQFQVTQGSLAGIATQYGHVRCKIEKLKGSARR